MLCLRVLAVAATMIPLSLPAHADTFGTPPLKAGRTVSIQAYGRQNPECTEWTNGCVVCLGAGAQAHCSTPGIACIPGGLTCKRHVKP